MEPTPILIGLDISLVMAIVYILDRNIFTYADLFLQDLFVSFHLRRTKVLLGIRLWFDRQALIHRGPLGRLWNEYTLWQIRNNPEYKEFFQSKDEQV